MNRNEFMSELEYLLQDIPHEDKADALAYYRDYLDEAGPEGEEQAIRDFGSPEKIAAIIRADIDGNLGDGGEFTESGFEDGRFREPNYQLEQRYEVPELNKEEKGRSREEGPRTNPVIKLILWIALIMVASPVILSVGSALFGVLLAAVFVLFVLFLIVPMLAVVFLAAGFGSFVYGLTVLMGDVVVGLAFMGGGLVSLGLGLFSLILTVLLFGKLVPWMFRGTVDGIGRMIYRGRRRRA